MIRTSAAKFARALDEVASESGKSEQVHRELEEFHELYSQTDELRESLTNPAIPFAVKRSIIEQVGRTVPVSKTVVNFLLVVLEKNRIQQLGEMLQAYQRILDEREGIVQVEVHSPHELEAGTRDRLRKSLEQLTGQDVRLNWQIDESLIGGLKLKIGSLVFDGTVRTQLDVIRRRLVDPAASL